VALENEGWARLCSAARRPPGLGALTDETGKHTIGGGGGGGGGGGCRSGGAGNGRVAGANGDGGGGRDGALPLRGWAVDEILCLTCGSR
jgi:hypothetical protein